MNKKSGRQGRSTVNALRKADRLFVKVVNESKDHDEKWDNY